MGLLRRYGSRIRRRDRRETDSIWVPPRYHLGSSRRSGQDFRAEVDARADDGEYARLGERAERPQNGHAGTHAFVRMSPPPRMRSCANMNDGGGSSSSSSNSYLDAQSYVCWPHLVCVIAHLLGVLVSSQEARRP